MAQWTIYKSTILVDGPKHGKYQCDKTNKNII